MRYSIPSLSGSSLDVIIPDNTAPERAFRAALKAAGGANLLLSGVDLTRASIPGVYLPGAYLPGVQAPGADLRHAELSSARLNGANLAGADMTSVRMCGADLRGANLSDAQLYDADMANTDLSGANLSGADMRKVNLHRANLTGADLRGAQLVSAMLFYADLTGALLPEFQVDQGVDLAGYKRLRGGLCELLIPAAARRTSSLVSQKCRAEYALVVSAPEDLAMSTIAAAAFGPVLYYRPGETVRPHAYDDDVRVDCAAGIHFFTQLSEAERYRV